ncbi:hypothetical protein SEA_JACKO_95 [Microbacterium phage Jacko]|nr:hypothetical protein SEA_JACKO_95 [Microbacterium phage Jacko]
MGETLDKALENERGEYENALRSVKNGDVSFMDHPGAKYAVVGFADGFKRGFMAGSGAAHAGISVVIGNIENGMYDADAAKEALIALRNAVVQEAGL